MKAPFICIMTEINTIVFDLGGVLIDWNPRYLYSKLFTNAEKMEWFLANVCHGDWNQQQDAGKPFGEATSELALVYPEYKAEIMAYFDRWIEMIKGPINGTVALLDAIAKKDFRLLALTNWSAETFPLVRHEYAFFDHFQEIVVSGEEKMAKPDPAFFQLLMDRHQVAPEQSLFIDDNIDNIKAANQLGFHTIRFVHPEDLGEKLKALGLL